MPLPKKFRGNFLLIGITIGIFSFGCGGSGEQGDENAAEIDSSKSAIINVEGEVFSIPSPIQTAILIKQIGTNYNASILSNPQNVTRYSTDYRKALNLGVYGADMGYVTLYDKTQDAISIMNAVKKLSDELGISGAFDAALMKKFEKNMGNKDSMLTLVSDAYRASDAFLKNNHRNEISGLILTGGWIESLYFATMVLQQTNNEEIKKRVAEQKSSLRGIIKILSKSNIENPENTKLIESLKDLYTVFEQVVFKYIYDKPTVDAENKITTVNGKTEIKITPENIKAIAQKVEAIRNQITD